MKTYISALGFDIWEVVKYGYIIPTTPPTDVAGKKSFASDSKAKNAIMCGLVGNELVKIMGCKIAKEICNKLQSIHAGDDKIKEAKLQTFISQFESLKMNDEEDITAYMLRVNEVINGIKGLREEIEDKVIVKKILRPLPQRFDSKVSAIKEAKDLNTFSFDEMQVSLIT